MPPPPVRRGGAKPRTKSDPALASPGNQVHIIAMERLTPSFRGHSRPVRRAEAVVPGGKPAELGKAVLRNGSWFVRAELMKKFILQPASIKTLVLLYFLVLTSAVAIIYTAVRVDAITYTQNLNYNNHLRYYTANALFRQGTDLLTDAARRYVVTLKPKYMEEYFKEVNEGRHRDRALETIKDMDIKQSLKDTLTNAMKASKALMNPECCVSIHGSSSRKTTFLPTGML